MSRAGQSITEITETIVGCAYTVGDTLGAGFLETVYKNALARELHAHGLQVCKHHAIQVYYDHAVVGEYIADMVVEGCVLVELKALRAVEEVHLAQCLNYLKATGMHLCLLINFGAPRVTVKRIVHNRFIDDEQP